MRQNTVSGKGCGYKSHTAARKNWKMPQCSVEWHFSHKKTLWIDMLFQHHSVKSVVNSKWQETVIIFVLHACEGAGNPNHKSVWCFSHRSAPTSSECISDLFPSHTSFCYLLRTSLGRGNALLFHTNSAAVCPWFFCQMCHLWPTDLEGYSICGA